MTISDNHTTYTLRARSAQDIANAAAVGEISYDGPVALDCGDKKFILDGTACRQVNSGDAEWLRLWQEQA